MKNIQYFVLFLSLVSLISLRGTMGSDFIRKFSPRHITEGDNINFPETGDSIKVHYIGTFPESGEEFDSSIKRKEPLIFHLGQGYVIPCWDEVIENMSKGEKLYFICPYSLAYGVAGAGNIIPPNTDIAFEVELIDIERKVEEKVEEIKENKHEDL